MKERPIIMSADSVRAILAGNKTQTRRVFKNPAAGMVGWDRGLMQLKSSNLGPLRFCPYGVPGDRLWIREGWKFLSIGPRHFVDDPFPCAWRYRADDKKAWGPVTHDKLPKQFNSKKWRSPIYMPRWASRITLGILNIRVERLSDIDNEGALAEGVDKAGHGETVLLLGLNAIPAMSKPIFDFAIMWNKLNKKQGFGWHQNPWVWVVEFAALLPERVEDGRDGRDRSIYNGRAGPVRL